MKQVYLILLLLLNASVSLVAQPIEFIENQGQWDGSFKYKANTGRGEIFLDKDGFMYLLGDPDNRMNMDAVHHGLMDSALLKFHAYQIIFEGSNTLAIEGTKSQETYYNYFLGNDSKRWKSNIHPYLDLDYKQLYDGIDMHITSEKRNIEYSFLVKPQADPSKIRVRFDGPDKLKIKEGNLEISTSVGNVLEMKPYAYQYINDIRVQVPCDYKLRGNIVTYSFPADYDHSQLLVIDPTIVFCTFTGSTADNWGFTATYDAQGNFYAGGLVNSLPSFPNNPGAHYPVSPGAFQDVFGGGSTTSGSQYPSDIAIMKFNSTGVNRIYATYIGGTNNEQPHSLIVDPATNNLIIAGRTYSNNYPVTANAYQDTLAGGADIVVTVLNSTGTGLVGSTYIGGSADDVVNFNALVGTFGNLKHNYGDDARSEVQVDSSGNIYVVACTKSSDFPITASPYQGILSGAQDGVIVKLNRNVSSLIWSTYIGGSGDDAAYNIVLNNDQSSFFVGGGTQSSNFPSTAGSYHSTYQGGTSDGFILKFQNSGNYNLQKGTFIGTANADQVYGLQVDAHNMVYAMGHSLGGTFPVSNTAYSNPNSTQFVIKLDSDLATNVYSTVFGSGDSAHTNISPVAFLVDTCENVYISGWGGNLGLAGAPASVGTTNNLPVTPNAAQTITDGYDFYFIVFGKNLASLQYATYFGRYSTDAGKGEHVDGGTSRFDKNGVIYQAICGNCNGSGGTTTTFPTQPAGVWSLHDSNIECNEVALKIALLDSTVACIPISSSVNNREIVMDNIDIFPNPNTGTFTISGNLYNKSEATVEIMNTLGQLVYKEDLHLKNGALDTQIKLNQAPSGVYMVTLKSGDGKYLRRMLVY